MEKDNQISEQVNMSDKEGIILSLVKDNKATKLCYRSIKISKAVSLVTAHIEDNKELKSKIRSVVLDMSDTAVLSLVTKEMLSLKDKNFVIAKGMTLLNCIEIAQTLGLISQTNSTILLQQINSFLNDFNEFLQIENSKEIDLSDDAFKIEESEAAAEEHVLEKQVPVIQSPKVEEVKSQKPFIEKIASANPKAHAESRVTRSSFHPTSAEFRQRLATAKTIEDLHGITPKNNTNESSQIVLGVKNDRQELIISTIGQKGELSIKDLEGVIKGCSEKTIQRELLALVEQGVLVKTGERRWSRYALAHA